jgi:hypothetical protein
MSISGKTLYALNDISGINSSISTYDISNPRQPILTNPVLIQLPGIAHTTSTVSGKYIYIVNTITNAVDLYDLTGALITSNFITGLPSGTTYYPQTITIHNNYLYIVWNNSGVSFFALSPNSPTTPISASPIQLIKPNGSTSVSAMTVFSNFLYVAIGTLTYRCDISNPNTPVIALVSGIPYSSGFAIKGNKLFSSNNNQNIVSQYSIASPFIAVLSAVNIKTGLKNPYGLLIYGDYLYIANEVGIDVYIIPGEYVPLVQRIGSMSTRYGNNYGKSAHSRPYYCTPLQMGDDIAIDVTCQSLALLTSQNSSQISFRVLKSGYYNPNNPSSYLGTLNYT